MLSTHPCSIREGGPRQVIGDCSARAVRFPDFKSATSLNGRAQTEHQPGPRAVNYQSLQQLDLSWHPPQRRPAPPNGPRMPDCTQSTSANNSRHIRSYPKSHGADHNPRQQEATAVPSTEEPRETPQNKQPGTKTVKTSPKPRKCYFHPFIRSPVDACIPSNPRGIAE